MGVHNSAGGIASCHDGDGDFSLKAQYENPIAPPHHLQNAFVPPLKSLEFAKRVGSSGILGTSTTNRRG
eukprot:458987-Hanusia_phi.AAC.1